MTSAWVRVAASAALVAVVGVGAVRADEPPPGAPPGGPVPAAPPAREALLDRGLAALKVRLEAKLKEAELLEQAGKLDEALAAVREVERLYREGLEDLKRLVAEARGGAPARAPSPVVPATEPRPPVPWDDLGPEPGLVSPVPPTGAFPARSAGASLHRRNAVLAGLRWLAAHQSENGGWEAAGFDRWCDGKANTGERPDGPGKPMYDVGVTGLALCAFLGAGFTNRGDHEFARVVRKGLAYLKNVQDPEGCFGPRSTQHYIYNHAIAALAMVEAYGMTESPIFKGSAQKALDFVALCRNPYFVWRYGVKPGDNDSSVTGWMMMALKSGHLVNQDAERRGRERPFVVDTEAFEGVRAWFEKVTDPDYGRVGYIARGSGPARPAERVDRFPGEKSESMTAVGLLARVFLGEDPRTSDLIRKGADLCGKLLPTWNTQDGSIDLYYWYYATLALFQVGGARWAAWERALDAQVLPNQRGDGTYCGFKGSWDPVDPWGPDGGRVYSTALMTMCLTVPTRYERAFTER